jgi:leucyl aminopeptidase (aminopeptidase T)
MLTERNNGGDQEPVQGLTVQTGPFTEDPHSWEAINRRLAERAKELHERDEQLERLSMGTSGMRDLTFGPPGGPLWQHNHPDN